MFSFTYCDHAIKRAIDCLFLSIDVSNKFVSLMIWGVLLTLIHKKQKEFYIIRILRGILRQ